MRKLFGTDGIRGIAGTELSADLAFRLGNAISVILNGSSDTPLLLASDTRISCDMLEYAVASGASAGGTNVLRCGIMPTPSLALITKMHGSVGVMISASHNSFEFNGLKVIRNGYKLPDKEEQEIEDILLSGALKIKNGHQIGKITHYPQARAEYIKYILNRFCNLKMGNSSGPLKIIMDVSNGAAFQISPEIMRTLGGDVKVINDEPDGININLECGSQHTDKLAETVIADNADIGIAYDGDADRCILVDEKGGNVDGDKIMCICAAYFKEIGLLKNDTVIATVMSNLGTEKYLESIGIRMLRARVGDRYVLEKMISTGSVMGGEQSGHIIFLDRSTTGDGLISSLTVLEAMEYFDRSLSELTEDITEYPQVLENVLVEDKDFIMQSQELNDYINKVKNELGDRGRVLLRPSGTEPLIRVMLEGIDMGEIKKYCSSILDMVRGIHA